jgi:site-specific recombinase XerD
MTSSNGTKSEGKRLASDFTEQEFWAFRAYMADDCELAPKTVTDRLTIIKQLFKFAAANSLIQRNPVAGAKVPDAPSTVQPSLRDLAKTIENHHS